MQFVVCMCTYCVLWAKRGSASEYANKCKVLNTKKTSLSAGLPLSIPFIINCLVYSSLFLRRWRVLLFSSEINFSTAAHTFV